jgi:hypothetical protein
MTGSEHSLSSIAFLAPLDDAARKSLEQRARWVRYKPNETIIDRESESRDVYFVVEGRVRVVNFSMSGREVTFDEMEAGSECGSCPTDPPAMFVFSPNTGGGQPFDGSYDSQDGFVAKSWSSDTDSANFPTPPTDGSTAVITGAILNDIATGTAASQALISMTISDSNSDTVIAGAGVANRQ